jgi:hypothetical protein
VYSSLRYIRFLLTIFNEGAGSGLPWLADMSHTSQICSLHIEAMIVILKPHILNAIFLIGIMRIIILYTCLLTVQVR